jgi:mannosyltransferase
LIALTADMLDLALQPKTSPVEQVRAARRLATTALAFGACAGVVAMLGSWIPSLGGDEAATVNSAKRSLGSLLGMLGHVDAVHGLYYVGMHFWTSVAGYSPFAVRLPGSLGVAIAAAAVVWMCGRMHSRRLAVIAGAVAVVLPRLTYAGEEARAYAFDAAAAAVLCAIVGEIVIGRMTRRGLWVAYTVVLVVGSCTFLYLWLLTVAVGVFLLTARSLRGQLRAWAVASALAVAALIPLAVIAYLERSQIAYLAKKPQVTPASLLVSMWFGQPWFALVAWALILVAIGGIVVTLVRRFHGRGAPGVRGFDGRPLGTRPDIALLALCWLMVPTGILVVTSPVVSGFTARYATLSAPAAAVLIAVGIDTLSCRRWMLVAAVTAVAAAAAPVWVAQRQPYAMNGSDWNDIAATVRTHAVPGDGILFDGGTRPSRRPRLAMDTDPRAFTAVRDVALETPYADNDTWYDKTYPVEESADRGRFHGIHRLWLVEYSTAGFTDAWGVDTLQQLGFHETTQYDLHSSVVYLFSR